jgi:hypothetical protein
MDRHDRHGKDQTEKKDFHQIVRHGDSNIRKRGLFIASSKAYKQSGMGFKRDGFGDGREDSTTGRA